MLRYFSAQEFAAHRHPQDKAADAMRGITPEMAYQQYLQIPLSRLGAGNTAEGNPVAWDTAVDTSQNPAPGVTSVRADGSAPNIGNVVSPAQVAANIAGGGDKMMPITVQSIEQGIANLQPQYDYNTGKPLAPGQAQSLYNTKTGQKIGSITTSSLQGATPTTVATPTSNSSLADSTVAGADATAKSIADYIKLLTPPDSTASNSVNDLISQISGDMNSLTGRGDAQLQAEQAQQVEQKKQTLQNYQTELNTALAEYKQAQSQYASLSQEQEGKAVTMSSIVGSQAQINKMALADLNSRAANISLIQANVASSQGNLSLAQSQADRVVDLRYQDVQDSIKIRQEQLSLLQNELTKDEKVRSDAISLYLQDQQQLVEEQKANAKSLFNFNIDAIQKYPSANIRVNDTYEVTQSKILNSREYQLATAKASGMGGGGTTPVKLTEAERVTAATSNFSQAFVQGAKLPSGIPVLDSEGFLTPEAFKAAIADAPSEGLTRSQFLTQFGYLLVGMDGTVSTKYGLTPSEIKLIGATAR